MELRQMRYFVAIAEERSFTRAAERLWVAQPSLSNQIRRLEAELGVQLFERHTRGVDLTDAGVLFLERVSAALAAAELAACAGSDLASGVVGTLRIGLSTPARWEPASVLLDAFMRTRPGVEVSVVECYSGTLARDLREGRIDAVVTPSFFGSADLQSISLGCEQWVVVVGRTHDLFGHDPLTAEDLEGEEVVITGHRDGGDYDRAVTNTLLELGVNASFRRGGAGPALLNAVTRGDALALSTASGARASDLAARPLEPARMLGYELTWQTESPSPALSELIRTASSHVWRVDERPILRAVA
jgi:DNA-binding transcriptional LysR family regulator